MKKYRIVENQYDDGSRKFQAQYHIGNEDFHFVLQCGLTTSDGWINIGDEKDTYRKALLILTNSKKSKIKFVSVSEAVHLIKTIIHEVD